jgi:septal ring factor EnvC (AmiA/AmiB activator)
MMKQTTKLNKKRTLFSLAVFISVHLFFSLPLSSLQDISAYKDRLAKIQQEKINIQKKIDDLSRRKNSILSQLDKIGLEKKLIQKELAEYNLEMQRANTELSSIQEQIPVLRKRVDKEKEAVAKILVTLYKFGNISYLDFLFRAEDVSDLMSENRHLTFLAQHQEDIILSFVQTLGELKETEDKLELKKEEVAGLVAQAQQKKKELDNQENKNRNFIRQIDQDRTTHLQTLEELKVRAQQLEDLIDRLLEEKSSLPFTVIPLIEKKGDLPWPVQGKIVSSFGLERHPRFNTVTENQGIEISTEDSTFVKAVHPGKVVYADFFQGFYGNLIILDHGLSYYSMYGHCSELIVRKGDIVEAGDTIAITGDTGSLKGTALYFQINKKTDPEDPLQWLKRR